MLFGHGILTHQRQIVWRAWLTALWLPAGATALALGREVTQTEQMTRGLKFSRLVCGITPIHLPAKERALPVM